MAAMTSRAIAIAPGSSAELDGCTAPESATVRTTWKTALRDRTNRNTALPRLPGSTSAVEVSNMAVAWSPIPATARVPVTIAFLVVFAFLVRWITSVKPVRACAALSTVAA